MCATSNFLNPKCFETFQGRFQVTFSNIEHKETHQLANFVHHYSVLPQKIKFTARIKRCGSKINITGCEDYENTFARIESDCMLRFGCTCKVLMKSIWYTKQSNLFLHFLSTWKRFSRSRGIILCLFL